MIRMRNRQPRTNKLKKNRKESNDNGTLAVPLIRGAGLQNEREAIWGKKLDDLLQSEVLSEQKYLLTELL